MKKTKQWYMEFGVDPDNREELEKFRQYNRSYKGRRDTNPDYLSRQYERNRNYRAEHLERDCQVKRDSNRRLRLNQNYGMDRKEENWLTIYNIIRILPKKMKDSMKLYHIEHPEMALIGFSANEDGRISPIYKKKYILEHYPSPV